MVKKQYVTGTGKTRPLALGILRATGALSQGALRLFETGEDAAFAAALDDLPDPSSSAFSREVYLARELLSKADFLDLGIDRDRTAWDSFIESEEKNSETNRRLQSLSTVGFNLPCSARHLVLSVQWKINAVVRDFSWNEALRYCNFGPGAAVGIPKRRSLATYKFGCLEPTVTEGCLELGRTALRWFDLWGGLPANPKVVPGNRLVTVPKNSKTNRTIAVEPLLNGFFQKGIGSLLRRRLLRVGVDLNDQTINQRLARQGSLKKDLATIDIRNASNSISSWLVFQLLPQVWFDPMNYTRSEYGHLPSGTMHRYQMFSSMGNGYTFELESLIFYAILSVCRDLVGEKGDTISVYGDDLIAPAQWTDVALECLRWFGFEPNRSKTFSKGAFRESCGKHYLDGIDITPFYIRKDIASHERTVWLANAIKRCANRWSSLGTSCDVQLHDAYVLARDACPTHWPLIPDGYGDGGLVSDFDVAQPKALRGKYVGWEGWETSHMVRVYKKHEPGGVPRLIKNLFSLDKTVYEGGSEFKNLKEVFPESVNGAYFLRKTKLVVPQWRDLGPWL